MPLIGCLADCLCYESRRTYRHSEVHLVCTMSDSASVMKSLQGRDYPSSPWVTWPSHTSQRFYCMHAGCMYVRTYVHTNSRELYSNSDRIASKVTPVQLFDGPKRKAWASAFQRRCSHLSMGVLIYWRLHTDAKAQYLYLFMGLNFPDIPRTRSIQATKGCLEARLATLNKSSCCRRSSLMSLRRSLANGA